ncbi:MAG: efflux RND transporter periplasmic adaptor subunit [Lysobacterales bacterium]|nr:MAG: efflux RND transporter periplasmic adaptor subunit [Xanthomonadales bacterium]
MTALANVLPEIKVDFPEEFDVWQTYFDSVRFDRPVPPLPEAGNQKTKLYLSRFNVYKLYFAVKDLEILLEKYEVRAPFDGNIVSAALRVGSSARNGSQLGTIINLEDLEVKMPMPAADIPWIDYDRPVLFTSADSDGQWQGRVHRVAGSIDERTQTVPVFVGLESMGEGTLFEGAFLEAAVPGRVIDSALEIPRRAIYSDRYVYVVTDGKLEFREVTVARALNSSVIVTGGLHNGDTLVVEPLQGVTPGMLATPRIISTSERSF